MVAMNGGRSVQRAVVVGTILQLAMVLAGHWVPEVAALFGPLGMAISLAAGWLAARWGGSRGADAARDGAIAGGVCAFIGILVSYALGDVSLALLLLGTLSSAVAGALGGLAAGLRPPPDRRMSGVDG